MAEPREMYKRIYFERLSISRSSGSSVSKPNQINMKVIIVVLALVALAASATVPAEVIPIVRSDFQQEPQGNYQFNYETGNGISRVETGELKEVLDEEKKPHAVIVVRGSYTYSDNDGKVETVNYVADESGYHAEGDSIPKAPVRR